MIIISLLFLAFISMNMISNSIKNNNIDKYINDMEKELNDELKTPRIKDNKIV